MQQFLVLLSFSEAISRRVWNKFQLCLNVISCRNINDRWAPWIFIKQVYCPRKSGHGSPSVLYVSGTWYYLWSALGLWKQPAVLGSSHLIRCSTTCWWSSSHYHRLWILVSNIMWNVKQHGESLGSMSWFSLLSKNEKEVHCIFLV